MRWRLTCMVFDPPTVTWNALGLQTLPASSFAVQDTVVVPSANMLPDEYVQEILGDAVMSSVAIRVKVAMAPSLDVASTCMSAGTESCGAVESTAARAVHVSNEPAHSWLCSSRAPAHV